VKGCVLILLALALSATSARADIFDFLKKKPADTNASSQPLSEFSQSQVADALKQALGKGVQTAITNLAKPNGFLSNLQVRIPMPEKLQAVEKTLRAMKQDQYADEFVATLNHAAEEAVPETLPIFTEALKAMTIDDAKKLVTGGNDSATQFFKSKGEKQIQEKMLPVVKEATAKTGVTAAYKKLLDQAGGNSFLGKFKINTASLDVDTYVAQKASDGLFKMVADEEKRIRENPAARTTELLEKVFGAAKRSLPQ
jgi:predicted exporter